MKRIVLIFFIFHFSFFILKAQHYLLYGTTVYGGQYKDGVLFRFDPFTGKDTILFNFNGTDGESPGGSLRLVSDKLLYGGCGYGGSQNDGVLFDYNILANTEDTVLDFTGINGANPIYSLILNNGILYGTTNNGGKDSIGVIFSYNPISTKHTVIFSFNDTDGREPLGELFALNDSSFYGMTVEGGKYNDGVIYKFNPITDKEMTLHNFNANADGAFPFGGFIEYYNGLFYGMTANAGPGGGGVLFSFNPITNVVTNLVNFTDALGNSPFGTLFLGSDSLLYGMTTGGARDSDGVLFSYNVSMNRYTILVNFNGTNGYYGSENLVEDTINKIIYGMTYYGGSYDDGVLFSYNIITGKDSVLINFDGTNGANPQATLLMIPDSLVRLGINQLNIEDEPLKVYPNPCNGVFTLQANSQQKSAITDYIEIYNILGEEVYSEFLLHSQYCTIDLTGQPNGVYFYRVTTEMGNLVGKGKVVVQR